MRNQGAPCQIFWLWVWCNIICVHYLLGSQQNLYLLFLPHSHRVIRFPLRHPTPGMTRVVMVCLAVFWSLGWWRGLASSAGSIFNSPADGTLSWTGTWCCQSLTSGWFSVFPQTAVESSFWGSWVRYNGLPDVVAVIASFLFQSLRILFWKKSVYCIVLVEL